jgi:hypothetical protein
MAAQSSAITGPRLAALLGTVAGLNFSLPILFPSRILGRGLTPKALQYSHFPNHDPLLLSQSLAGGSVTAYDSTGAPPI